MGCHRNRRRQLVETREESYVFYHNPVGRSGACRSWILLGGAGGRCGRDSHDVLQTRAVVLLQEGLNLALFRGAEGWFVERQENLKKKYSINTTRTKTHIAPLLSPVVTTDANLPCDAIFFQIHRYRRSQQVTTTGPPGSNFSNCSSTPKKSVGAEARDHMFDRCWIHLFETFSMLKS